MTLSELHQILKESDSYLLRIRVALAEAEDECMDEECGKDHDEEEMGDDEESEDDGEDDEE